MSLTSPTCKRLRDSVLVSATVKNSLCRFKRRVGINMVSGATWLLVLAHVRLSSLVMRSNGVFSSQGRPLLGHMLVS